MPIRHKRSSTAGYVPPASALVPGQFGLNDNDGKLFWLNASGVVRSFNFNSGLPAGGTTGQVLTKTGNGDYAVGWAPLSGGGGPASLAFTDIGNSGDLATTNQSTITFTGLQAYADLEFAFAAVSHNQVSTSQAVLVAISADGTSFGTAVAITGTVGSTSRIHGQGLMVGNGGQRIGLRFSTYVGNPVALTGYTAGEQPRFFALNGQPIQAVRFSVASGTMNNGIIYMRGR